MDIKTFKITFDEILKQYIEEKTLQAKTLLSDERLNSYIEYIKDFLFSGGKRIRPYGMWLMYKGLGGTSDADSMRFAITFEVLHSMALIHDDIMDKAEKRHNIPTVHRYVASRFDVERPHIGEAQAILIGDLLFSRVYELSNENHNFPHHLLVEARKNLHIMGEEVILGQMIDVDMMAWGSASYELIEKKNYYKTASYTFIRPMLGGAILADADQETRELVKEFGKYMGWAFQLRDDMMDIVFGDDTKTPFSDIQEGQQTYFTNYVFTQGSESQKEILTKAMGKKLDIEEIHNLQHMFKESGALSSAENLLWEYGKKAYETLQKINFKDTMAKDQFTALIQKLATI
jgi:geranylgeranyl diphosphate synthase, type I